jgi:hypothetical protein
MFPNVRLIYDRVSYRLLPLMLKLCTVISVLARADEGERLWTRIEEREKKFKFKEIVIEVLRNENTDLRCEKQELQAEIEKLKKCFGMVNDNLDSPANEDQMPWLMSQLRENVSLKEKVDELEEIIRCKGYTVKAAAAERDFNVMKAKLALKKEELTKVIEMLKGQLVKLVVHDNFEVPIYLGKLEEALSVFGNEVEKQSVSTECSNSSVYSKEDDFEVPMFLDKLEGVLSMFGHEVEKHSVSTIFSDLSVNSKEDSRENGCCF